LSWSYVLVAANVEFLERKQENKGTEFAPPLQGGVGSSGCWHC